VARARVAAAALQCAGVVAKRALAGGPPHPVCGVLRVVRCCESFDEALLMLRRRKPLRCLRLVSSTSSFSSAQCLHASIQLQIPFLQQLHEDYCKQ